MVEEPSPLRSRRLLLELPAEVCDDALFDKKVSGGAVTLDEALDATRKH